MPLFVWFGSFLVGAVTGLLLSLVLQKILKIQRQQLLSRLQQYILLPIGSGIMGVICGPVLSLSLR